MTQDYASLARHTDAAACPKILMRFTSAEGAGAHCQVGAQRLAFGCIYDWLDETFGLV